MKKFAVQAGYDQHLTDKNAVPTQTVCRAQGIHRHPEATGDPAQCIPPAHPVRPRFVCPESREAGRPESGSRPAQKSGDGGIMAAKIRKWRGLF